MSRAVTFAVAVSLAGCVDATADDQSIDVTVTLRLHSGIDRLEGPDGEPFAASDTLHAVLPSYEAARTWDGFDLRAYRGSEGAAFTVGALQCLDDSHLRSESMTIGMEWIAGEPAPTGWSAQGECDLGDHGTTAWIAN